MRTLTQKAWPSIREEDSIVEPKSTPGFEVVVPQKDVSVPTKMQDLQTTDILFTLEVKREHIFIACLLVLVFLLTVRLSFVSSRLALLETSYTTRMK